MDVVCSRRPLSTLLTGPYDILLYIMLTRDFKGDPEAYN